MRCFFSLQYSVRYCLGLGTGATMPPRHRLIDLLTVSERKGCGRGGDEGWGCVTCFRKLQQFNCSRFKGQNR
jgi:hypothetical protein